MKYLYALIVLLMALFLAAFITQNGQEVVLKYFYWNTIPLPLSLFMILAFAAGYALAVIVGLSSGIRSRVRVLGAEREARRLRAEVQDLKYEEKKESLEDSTAVSRKEDVPVENDIEDDTYTAVNLSSNADGEEDLKKREEEKGKR
jgi:uncharacterized integral membrane protein